MTTTLATATPINLQLISEEATKMGELVLAEPRNVAKLAEVASKFTFQPASQISETEITTVMSEIDLTNTNSITRFGAAASEQATAVSRQMLDGVRNKDTGPAGEIMNSMMLEIRGLNTANLKGGGIFGWLKSKASRLASFTQQFEEIQGQIEKMSSDLQNHQTIMMTSVATMDRLYDATVIQFHDLEVYILAGERMLDILNSETIPTLQNEVETGKIGSDGTPTALMPQKLNDLIGKRDQLERKVHDLKLVRMVSLQALPKIRMTQDSDNNLIAKIDTIIATTIPIWYQQVAMNLEVAKTQKAADAVTNVADATEELLVSGAEQFKTATIDAKRAVERSVVGIDAVEKANQLIIETMQEAVGIVQEGKKARAAADEVLLGTEQALREALKQTAASQAAYK